MGRAFSLGITAWGVNRLKAAGPEAGGELIAQLSDHGLSDRV
jgi:hypothetical protein